MLSSGAKESLSASVTLARRRFKANLHSEYSAAEA
jgi:hypothetical protein